MLIEHRTYTLQLGAAQAFWQAQQQRGGEGLKAIFQRLIGTFSTSSGPSDQLVSIYRYDSFDDWQTRLLGLYGQANLQAYFAAVRPLIARQESRFLVPAPVPALTPHWGNGHDWLPGAGAMLVDAIGARSPVVEECTWTFSAGGVPACWAAFRQCGLETDSLALESLLGAFSTVVGVLNQVILYRVFADANACLAHRNALQASTRWAAFQQSMAPLTQSFEHKLLTPSRVADMSPLFVHP